MQIAVASFAAKPNCKTTHPSGFAKVNLEEPDTNVRPSFTKLRFATNSLVSRRVILLNFDAAPHVVRSVSLSNELVQEADH